jgi:hypothetical protein
MMGHAGAPESAAVLALVFEDGSSSILVKMRTSYLVWCQKGFPARKVPDRRDATVQAVLRESVRYG